jgi:hypothetical protein
MDPDPDPGGPKNIRIRRIRIFRNTAYILGQILSSNLQNVRGKCGTHPAAAPLPVGCRPGGVLEGAVLDIRDEKDGPLVEANGLVTGLAIKTHPKKTTQ